MRTMLAGLVLGFALTGCTTTARVPVTPSAGSAQHSPSPSGQGRAMALVAAPAVAPSSPESEPGARSEAAGPWLGAAGASDFLLPGTRETQLGVWIDVPAARRKVRAPAAVALVVDTSGSMGGAKIEHARAAAKAFVDKLPDGDILSLASFADTAEELVAPTALSAATRPGVMRAIATLEPTGSTNLFDGLRLAERRAVTAPATHGVRRVVLISDGQANVGPSSPDVLGAIAQRGADHGVQVTSLGVGADYDERTLNALAVASSGRLYHLTEPREMSSIMERELALLQSTAATEAFVEIVPAPGVELLGADGARTSFVDGALRVPLGSMFGGQHREMLVRVRVTAPDEGTHALASVRLHFRDPANGNLDRVQEVVARYDVTSDPSAVASHQNEKTQTIAAVLEAGRVTVNAAQQVNKGDFEAAERQLAAAEARLRDQAVHAQSAKEKSRAIAAATSVATARQTAQRAAAAPAPMRRMDALKMNSAGMVQMGY